MPEIIILDFAISLIITVTVYSLPIIIARYAIIRRPVERKTAKVVCIFYAILGLIIMTILAHAINGDNAEIQGGGLLLWSYVNYKMLTTGKDFRKSTVTMPQHTPTPMPQNNGNYCTTKSSDVAPLVSVPQKSNAIKTTYCKRCGSRIDASTKKCSGCGKQYFHIPRLSLSRCAIAIVVIALMGINIYQYIDYGQKIEALNEDLIIVQTNYKSLLTQFGDVYTRAKEAERENLFWDTNAVICTPSGEKYHEYGCSHLVNRDYTICTAEEAKRRGYSPCLDCCSVWDIMGQK